jgi:hypothetical protein
MGRPSTVIVAGVAALAPGGSRQSQAGGRGWQERTGRRSGGWYGVLLPQFELAGQTHSCGQGLGVLDPDVDAERRLETSRE